MLPVFLSLLVGATPEAIIWGQGKPAETERAMEAWFAARDRGALPDIRLGPGFPRVVPDLRERAPPGNELVVLGACAPHLARRVLHALRGANPHVTSRVIEGEDLRGTCPSLARIAMASVEAALASRGADVAAAAARARAHVAPCSETPRQRSDDALCVALWGIDCATYVDVVSAIGPRGARCPFLLGTPSAERLLQLQSHSRVLTACLPTVDDPVAFVFARPLDGEVEHPVDVICGQGPDIATRLGRARTVGAGMCIETVRTLSGPGGPTRQSGLRCYVPLEQAPWARADEVVVEGDPPMAYRIDGEAVCLRRGANAPWALRLGPRGLEPEGAPPAGCMRGSYQVIGQRPQ
jgi:hypothetical protein